MAFNDDEIVYVLDLNSFSEESQKLAVDLFNESFQGSGIYICSNSVRKIWANYGLRSRNGSSRYGFSDVQIRELHARHRGDFQAMLTDYGFSSKTLRYKCRELELKVSNLPRLGKEDQIYRYRIFGTHRSRRSAPRHS